MVLEELLESPRMLNLPHLQNSFRDIVKRIVLTVVNRHIPRLEHKHIVVDNLVHRNSHLDGRTTSARRQLEHRMRMGRTDAVDIDSVIDTAVIDVKPVESEEVPSTDSTDFNGRDEVDVVLKHLLLRLEISELELIPLCDILLVWVITLVL